MESRLTLVLALFFVGSLQLATSQSPSERSERNPNVQTVHVQPHSTQPQSGSIEQGSTSGKSQDVGYTHYTYRTPGATGAGSSTYQSYPGASYTRDNYGTSRDMQGNPIFGVNSNADFHLSAYFGQIFWAIVAVTLTLVFSIWIIRFFSGTDLVGGIVEKIKDSGATGKALDLDRLTNMVYQAFETYGRYPAKEARHVVEASQKGR